MKTNKNIKPTNKKEKSLCYKAKISKAKEQIKKERLEREKYWINPNGNNNKRCKKHWFINKNLL